MSTEHWTSKLGHEYDRSMIERNEAKTKAELNRLRLLPGNRECADCGTGPTVWASVNLGVFLCLKCGSHHRAIGTHISKPKGCSGTYLWGPDEVDMMERVGNAKAREIYGGVRERPALNASDAVWRNYLTEKYYLRKFAPAHSTTKNADHYDHLLRPDEDPKTSKNAMLYEQWMHPDEYPLFADTTTTKKPIMHPIRPESPPDLISFGHDSHSGHPPLSPTKGGGAQSDDFFAQFGL